jgi:FixJ family two-component response regulator
MVSFDSAKSDGYAPAQRASHDASAVRFIRVGAATFIETPLPEHKLQDAVHEALQLCGDTRRDRGDRRSSLPRFAPLTLDRAEVCDQVERKSSVH